MIQIVLFVMVFSYINLTVVIGGPVIHPEHTHNIDTLLGFIEAVIAFISLMWTIKNE